MTAKREAELETENRMLREQVASLERIVEQVSRPTPCLGSQPYAPVAPYPWSTPLVTWSGGTETSLENSPVSGHS
jgi:hypothetical protein